ncbi:HlyD family type I secretion periplasmic adaptor subunit [Arcobacter sp. F2176]|uniref:HlyD family type I secretion periplasmic adaptor subunit n=1 Tax=Arcobacter sp. F2176 TaxID=2044511 RepID=UPI00100AC6A4|nr:HlyD family type I secretion periplasmic adaptor subunit [Arcobacter sp. F2176]RXJ81249.1 hemolysin secretion protein D [Arcobacter sp. F2176]
MSLKDKFIEYSYKQKDKDEFCIKDEIDFKYMDSLSAAMLIKNKLGTKIMLWVSFVLIIFLFVWAYFSEIDALTRGQGKVIPTHQIQVIQNLEGGIVSEILVEDGQNVKKGDILIRIDDTGFISTYAESSLKFNELEAKALRLQAESTGEPFIISEEIRKKSPTLIGHEESLYKTNLEQLENNINIYKRRLTQKQNERDEAVAKLKQLKTNYQLISKEVALMEPLVEKKLVSEVEFLQLKREESSLSGEIEAIKLSLPRLLSIQEEQQNNIKEVELKFRNTAKEAFNETRAEMSRISETNVAKKDRVNRTLVRSPVDGTIKQLLINTVGGVVKPGMDIVEIVPIRDKLLVEAKVRPSDIAFLYPGQKAIVKFSAYDFAVYGSLEGVLTHISADTIVDEVDKQSYYLVKIKTNKSYLGSEKNKLNVMVGMTADVDIVTGKKTILSYILKPIFRATQNVWSER